MEAIDREIARQANRLDPKALLPVEIKSLSDIKRLVGELDPRRNPVHVDIPLATTMQVTQDNREVVYKVETSTKSKSKRDMLVEGLDVIKHRAEMETRLTTDGEPVEINGKIMKPAKIGNGVEGKSWVDPLIKQWLGGYRDGTDICWDLGDGYIIRYDIYNHKLTRTDARG